MSTGGPDLEAIRDGLAAQLARCAEVLAAARDDAAILAVRDLLLDIQFENRALITAAEERLGAFSGEDDPRVVAARAEELIEQAEGLQDAWESRVDLLLEAGFDNARIPEFFDDALADPDGVALLDDVFTGLPGDMDQTVEMLEWSKRYLLSLLGAPAGEAGGGHEGGRAVEPAREREGGRGRRRDDGHGAGTDRQHRR